MASDPWNPWKTPELEEAPEITPEIPWLLKVPLKNFQKSPWIFFTGSPCKSLLLKRIMSCRFHIGCILMKYHDIASIYINMEPAGQILLRNLHDHSPFRQQEVTRAFRKKNHGDFLKFFRGTFKSQGISGVISGASSNSGALKEFRDFRGRWPPCSIKKYSFSNIILNFYCSN